MTSSHTAVLGAGTIGASWAALFLASGRSVAVYDPSPDVERTVRSYVETAWPTLTALGLTDRGTPEALSFHATAAEAVEGAGFVQESVPERLPLKHVIFAEIEPALAPDAVVSSSASGLTLGQMQGGWRDPARFILGHPFNPPHLVPLVEIMGNDRTSPGVIEAAEVFYKDVGKTTIRVLREVQGHVANRLQAAIWREAIHLVLSGVASVHDVDKAITDGPGLRWAAMGPTTLFHLGAGDQGLEAYIAHFTDTYNGWWQEMGQVTMSAEVGRKLAQGLEEVTAGRSVREMAALRDARLVAIRQALSGVGL